MKLNFAKLEEDNRKYSKLIESILNDPKNHGHSESVNIGVGVNIGVSNSVNINENKDIKDMSNTFFSKNKENMVNLDEKNDSVIFNGGNKSSVTQTQTPTVNAGNLIKLKEVCIFSLSF